MNKLTEVSIKNGYRATYNHYRKLEYPLFLMLLVLLLTSPAQAKYSGVGNGEPNNPYQIADANDMNEIGLHDEDWGSHFILVNDINLADYTGTQFNIIGTGYFTDDFEPIFVSIPFTGSFDGNNFTISNFNYSCTGTDFIYCIGLFGVVDGTNAEIKNLRLVDTNIHVEPGDRIGSLVGFFLNGTITGCCADGGSVSGDYRVGGLVGQSGNGVSISNCYASTSISGHAELGGLVGSTYYGFISTCYSAGNVIATGYFVGGLVGGNYYGTISNCYCTGSVLGTTWRGGLVGENRGLISNCYTTSNVPGTGSHIGGLVGYSGVTGTVTASFWDVNSTGQSTSDGGEGKTTAEMKTESTFTDAGWDFIEIWNIGENQTYPYLRVYPAGDLNHDGIVNMADFAIFADHWLAGVE